MRGHLKTIFAGPATTSDRTLLAPVVSDIFDSKGILLATAQLGMSLGILAAANHARVTSAVLVAASCTTLRTVPEYKSDDLPTTT